MVATRTCDEKLTAFSELESATRLSFQGLDLKEIDF